MSVRVIGAGLAGCEAAWQLAKRGISVRLYEMKPKKFSPAHHSSQFAELVCSNSLRADLLSNAVGLLKQEMRELDSLIMKSADRHRVPAGGALAVDREEFSKEITDTIRSHPLIEIVEEEVTSLEGEESVIVATGPLTSEGLIPEISRLTGEDYLHFYDAAAPIVTYESIQQDKVFRASRYDKGEADYLNCPMTKEEYDRFYRELVQAETAVLKEFEQGSVFEGCMPIEVMAKRGEATMLFGPLKPVGLKNPRDDRPPYAVVQLRQDDAAGSLYNIVGFQTNLKWGEQKRVFSLIPGLEHAEFARYGVMHRNTFLNSPKLLDHSYRLKKDPRVYFAGQMTGVEGYAESAASGLTAGLFCGAEMLGGKLPPLPEETALGALAAYVSNPAVTAFQPMNVNFGLLPPLGVRIKGKREKNEAISQRALEQLRRYKEEYLHERL
ncbi:MAG: methylenetetrahydrofolate--tRNA-(uracil(54)-C(5))-methyltransferase (FADH(2)-oxidizing) TrmFO [Clostridia bacterium]|nr:methylenetetrahydrofolate--tRNA-(uracil(54)-C(5))-methyltransferase (FADH(2)-oxidizing) TrmFO [Clostridia bacterium]